MLQKSEIVTDSKLAEERIPRVLIVEDDVTLQYAWTVMVEMASPDASCEWARTEIEAEALLGLAVSSGKPYDLIICDIFLAGNRTGLDLVRRYQHVISGKVILVSSISYGKMKTLLGRDFNPPLYVQKPLKYDDCLETLRKVLTRNVRH